MFTLLQRVLFILASYGFFAVYTIRAYDYCRHILTPAGNHRYHKYGYLVVNTLTLTLILFCTLPVFLSLLIVYFVVMLQFLYSFRGDLVTFIFGSGTLMFHVMNVKMVVTSIFVLVYEVPTYRQFRQSGLYLFCTCVTILLLLISLEVFKKVINLQMIQTLMTNRSQLRFVTSSMMLINIYLLILSVSYNNQAYSGLTGVFLLSTALLLFGAFYTSFWHAIKMSVMMERELKSRLLEEQLQATREDVEELQAFAFIDTLTAVHNRRFGLEELDKRLKAREIFCLCFLDIDRLKSVNDTYGHEEGDHYILDVVKVLTSACKREDTLSRMGGDEFMLLLPHTAYLEAETRLQDVHETVSRIPSLYHPSVSYGIVEVGTDAGLNASEILRQADREMYRFKRANSPVPRVRDTILK